MRSVDLLKKLLLVTSAALAVYVVSDIFYRIFLHNHLEHNSYLHTRYSFSSIETPLYVLDDQTGYSYRPNLKLRFRLYDQENNLIRENRLLSNNFGHIELEDDSLAKPPTEFRIAVLGDSFSATLTSDVAWPTELQQDLNQDAALKKIIGKSTFKVINFGLDGTGVAQWPSVYEYKVKAFAPDLVVVNSVWSNISRRFIYRDTLSIGNDDQIMIVCSSLPVHLENNDCLNAESFVLDPNHPDYRTDAARSKKELYERMVGHLPWFSPYPELLAALLNGRLGFHPRLQFRDHSHDPSQVFGSQEAALAASLSALGTIASEQHALLVLYHPFFEECLAKQPPPTVKELMKREKDVKIENMLDFLPLGSGQDEVKKWYNLPYDVHPSNYGAKVYARAVEGRVFHYLSQSQRMSQEAPTADSNGLTTRVASE